MATIASSLRRPPLHPTLLQAEFYAPFLRKLHGVLGGRCSVAAISHLGMDLRGLTPPGKAFTLQDQIDHKAAILADSPSLRGAPVFVLGHSIGAYMALHAVEKLEALSPPDPAAAKAGQRAEVAAVIACMPFLETDFNSAQQRLLRRATSLYWLLAPLATVLQYLPIRVRRWLVGLVGPGMESHAAEVAVSLFNPTAVLNGLYLGGLEFKTLAAPADWWLLRKLGQRFVAICAPEDTWMPRKHYDAMLQVGSAGAA